jgi:hypothetical protein
MHDAIRALKNNLAMVAAYVVSAVLGGIVVWKAGHRGFFFYDQSGVFDGAWRLVQGQVIYRDFFVPYGPTIFFIQWLFFRIAGVDLSSMVLSAAVVNSLAVVIVIWLIRRLLPDPDQRPTAVAGGLLTAVWFQAPTGTLWFEQVAFLFNLISLALVLKATQGNRTSTYLRITAGWCLVISILSKQSAGIVFLPVPLVAVVIEVLPDWRKALSACSQIVVGMALASAAFVAWLWLFSSPTGFWQSVIVMSRALGGARVSLIGTTTNLLWLKTTWRLVWWPLALFGATVVLRGPLSIPNGKQISWLILSYTFLQNLFASITFNELQNEVGYLGLINALAFGLFYEVFWKKKLAGKHWVAYWVTAPFMAVMGFYIFLGWAYSNQRIVLEFSWDTRFSDPVHVRGASRLRWGEPTLIDKINLTRKDFEDVNAWLDKTDGNFYVFPDSTLLYGLHHRVSPQPWVYFMPDQSFLKSDIAHVDETILKSLQKNNVTIVVLEKRSWALTRRYLDQMPKLQGWIDENFQKTTEFGLYEIWTRGV